MMRLLILVIVLLAAGQAEATTWYVNASTGNNGNSCAQAESPSTPKQTINAALACVGFGAGAGANDVVEVANGTYTETVTTWPSGTFGNPFTLRAANQYGAVFAPGSGTSQIIRFDSGADHVVMDGFDINATGVLANTVWFDAGSDTATLQNSRIRNVEMCDFPCNADLTDVYAAIYCPDCQNSRVLNNEIFDVGVAYKETSDPLCHAALATSAALALKTAHVSQAAS